MGMVISVVTLGFIVLFMASFIYLAARLIKVAWRK